MENKDIESLDYVDLAGIKQILYRKETTDLNCLKEVLVQNCYKNKQHNIYVEEGESWLDLGANIGAFGLYCFQRKVRELLSFEPVPDNFEIMQLNYDRHKNCIVQIVNTAVTNREEEQIQFYRGGKENDRYRTTIVPNKRPTIEKYNNIHGSLVLSQTFDGVKMDIEGSELGLIDDNLIPKCKKLIMEYHITKDKSMKNFHRRMDILRKQFEIVHYFPSLDKFDRNGEYPGFFDRFIFCKNN